MSQYWNSAWQLQVVDLWSLKVCFEGVEVAASHSLRLMIQNSVYCLVPVLVVVAVALPRNCEVLYRGLTNVYLQLAPPSEVWRNQIHSRHVEDPRNLPLVRPRGNPAWSLQEREWGC